MQYITPDQFDPETPTPTPAAPAGPREVSPTEFDQPQAEGLQPTSVLNELTRLPKNIGREILAGGKAAFRPEYSSAAPSAYEKYVSTPGSQLMGVLRMLGSVPTALGEEAKILNQRVRGMQGLPQNQAMDLTSQLVGALATPSGLANAPLTVLRKPAQMLLAPLQRGITEATTTSRVNSIANASQAAKIAEAKAAEAAAHAELATSAAELDKATLNLAQRQGIQLTSPFGASLSNKLTNEQAFAFLGEVPPGTAQLPLTNLQRAAESILSRFEPVPKALQPSKFMKTATELTGETPTLSGVPVGDMTAQQKAAWAPLLDTIKGHNQVGGLDLTKLAQFKQSIGDLTRVTGSEHLGRQLYRGLMDDLRIAAKTDPVAAQALRANEIASQNLAAKDIADIVTMHGTQRTAAGKLVIKPNVIEKRVAEDELLKQLPPDQQKRFIDTINDVYRIKTRVATAEAGVKTAAKGVKAAGPESTLPEIITPGQASKLGGVSRFVSAAAGAVAGGVAGSLVGHPYVGAVGGAELGRHAGEQLSQLIFQIALKPRGQDFLKTLFADIPPVVGDAAKLAALQNFLASQGGQ